jgi:hypothetical protein
LRLTIVSPAMSAFAHRLSDELRGGQAMKNLAIMVGLVLCAMLVGSCATSQNPGGLPQSKGAVACQPGFYYCHGEIAGCCPNGWGCASTHCIRPQPTKGRKAEDRSCRPGFFFCPGEVSGCCPNGWGCASTHCVRPPRKVDL